MFRTVVRIARAPVRTFPTLAAAIGCLVSGYSTYNGIAEIFPEFGYAAVAALGLAGIIQLGMVTSTLAYEGEERFRPLLVSIVVVTVLMSSFTSYIFYFRGYSEETIAKERQLARSESLRGYLVEARSQTAGALGILDEAGAELRRRIEIEETTGGGLRNLSNPYLQRLVAQSDLDVDLATVESGTGERYRFLSSVLPRVEQMQGEMRDALARLDAELAGLADVAADPAALHDVYSRAAAVVPADRIRELRGDFSPPPVDAAVLDGRPLVEEEYWQRAVHDLVVVRAPAAVVFAFIALFVDLMIVFFAFMASQLREGPGDARLPLRHWLDLAYGDDAVGAVGRWLAALDGARLSRAGTTLHRIELERLDDPRDLQCRRFLRQDGYLRQHLVEDGSAHWWLTGSAYGSLLELVTGGEGRERGASGRNAATASDPRTAPGPG